MLVNNISDPSSFQIYQISYLFTLVIVLMILLSLYLNIMNFSRN